MVPTRYMTRAKPIAIKRVASSLKHVSAPLKGLSLTSKLAAADPLTAVVLDNFIVEENRIRMRAGTRLLWSYSDPTKAVEHLVPFYGAPGSLAAAIDGKLIRLDGTLIGDGFTSNDWSWTSFSNLSSTDYTVMVNGTNGVWSWNGGAVAAPETVPITVMDNLNPVRVTVAPENIGKFLNGETVVIAGGVGDWTFVNGPHVIGNVGVPAPNSFELVGVDGTVAAMPQVGGGATAELGASVIKEIVTAPASEPWVVPDQFNVVLSHMNRLWFADHSNLAVYYLPLQQKSGEVKVLPLNAIFKRGGSVRALFTWTTEGGTNMDDQLVVFSSNGEAAIYTGVDPGPDGDMYLTGVYRFDAPMSKHSVTQYGGDLWCLISTGLVPMSTLMRAESEQLGQKEQNVVTDFLKAAQPYRNRPGWEVFINPTSSMFYCNLPQGASNRYRQLVRNMARPVWQTWSALPSRCWGWLDARVYFGSDDGKVYEFSPNFLNDNGQPIKVDVQPAWQNFGTPATKHFKMVKPYIQSDGTPRPYVDIKVDYDTSPPANQPDVTFADSEGAWDEAVWDIDGWASEATNRSGWTGVGRIAGSVAAPRTVALVSNAQFAITGWDVLYEPGSIFG